MTQDYADRDSTIRINSYTTVLRRPGVPHELFAHYWRDVHGPLCARLPGLGWYVQHHFDREQDGHLWPVLDDVPPLPSYVLDGMVEIGFAGTDEQTRFKDASPILFSDEQNMFEETVAYDLPRGSHTLIDHLSDPAPNGPDDLDRIHVHLSARTDAAAFQTYVAGELAPALAAHPSVLKLRLHLPEPHDNAEPNPPAPDVDHAVPPPRKTVALLELAFPDPLVRRAFYASEAFTRLQAGLRKHCRNATAFGVSGVYTYIRDGVLTTAGLRGSRAAELIRRLGANNQLTPDVRSLMEFHGSAPA